MSSIVVYNNGELELKVSVNDETIWLNRNQLAELFERDVKTIGKHINNVFQDGELDKISAVANFATVQNEGGREAKREIEHYNLEIKQKIFYKIFAFSKIEIDSNDILNKL